MKRVALHPCDFKFRLNRPNPPCELNCEIISKRGDYVESHEMCTRVSLSPCSVCVLE